MGAAVRRELRSVGRSRCRRARARVGARHETHDAARDAVDIPRRRRRRWALSLKSWRFRHLHAARGAPNRPLGGVGRDFAQSTSRFYPYCKRSIEGGLTIQVAIARAMKFSMPSTLAPSTSGWHWGCTYRREVKLHAYLALMRCRPTLPRRRTIAS